MRNEEGEDEAPWNEAKWERFFQESEVRSAKYGELLETFLDHPDRDEIIAHEMGWDKPAEPDEIEAEDGETPFDAEALLEEVGELDEEEWREEQRAEEAALKAIPAYQQGYAFALKVQRALKKFLDQQGDDADDTSEDAGEAFINAHLIAVKIAGAHAMGYEDEVLCGNIVRCKRSLQAANECVDALERLRERAALPQKKVDALIAECKEVRELVEQHIAELRGRVWWQ